VAHIFACKAFTLVTKGSYIVVVGEESLYNKPFPHQLNVLHMLATCDKYEFPRFSQSHNGVFTILAVIKLFSINFDFSQDQVLAISKVLKNCLILLLTTQFRAWRCGVLK
jgi:hypothetical protein